jgi:hypothetical protein
MDPMTLSALGTMGKEAVGAIPGLVSTIVQAVPGKLEKQLRDQMAADQKRLAGGAGGMSQGALQQAQAGIANTVQAQQQQALAQLARGSAMGGGESGVRLAQQGAVLGAGQQAMQQGMSQLREQDLAYAQQQRAMNEQMRQQLMGMAEMRKQAALPEAQRAMGLTPMQVAAAQQSGADQRGDDAARVSGLAGSAGDAVKQAFDSAATAEAKRRAAAAAAQAAALNAPATAAPTTTDWAAIAQQYPYTPLQ